MHEYSFDADYEDLKNGISFRDDTKKHTVSMVSFGVPVGARVPTGSPSQAL